MESNYDHTACEAQFAALMDALGARLGADALAENAALQKDPTAAVPEPVRRHCMEVIARYGTVAPRRVRRVFWRIAVAALVALLLLATAFAVSPSLREKTAAFIREVFDTHTEFRMTEPTGTDLSDYSIETGWLPEDMELVEEISGKSGKSLCYRSSDGALLRISIYSIRIGSALIDSEHASIEAITLQEQPATLIINENSIQVIIERHVEGLMIRLSCENLITDDILRIAENLKISQK